MENNRSIYRIAKMAENILNRDFKADRPGQKMVIGITYIPTDEGWLYLAGVMDLCGDKVVGVSMGGRMAKELVMETLWDVICHTETTEGCILLQTAEAQSAVFGYIWIFYNRRRTHEANVYLTPEEYYDRHQKDLKAA